MPTPELFLLLLLIATVVTFHLVGWLYDARQRRKEAEMNARHYRELDELRRDFLRTLKELKDAHGDS